MKADEQIRSLYQELEAAHVAMLEKAQAGEWEEVARIGQDGEAIRARIASLQGEQPLPPELGEALAPILARTLELVNRLRTIAEPARTEVAAQIASNVQQSKLNQHYGV